MYGLIQGYKYVGLDKHMISGMQVRAARAMLRWGVRELARKAGISPTTVVVAESDRPVAEKSLEAIEDALSAAGVQFIPDNDGGPGVRLAKRKRKSKR